MALVGETITDDALFGIPEPDYGDESDDDVKQQDTTKQQVTATLSTESNKSNTATSESSDNIERATEQRTSDSTDEEHIATHTDHSSNDDEKRRSSDSTKLLDDDAALNFKHSPDVTGGALSPTLHESNRGSGGRSPISPPLGVSHDHVAVDPVLIEAKKNPNVRQLTKEQKELQRELQFKAKQGVMLEKKPELVKAMDDRKFKIKKEEQKQRDQENKPSTLNVKLGQQAKKLMQLEEQEEKKKSIASKTASSGDQQLDEFRKIHSKIHKNNVKTS